MIFRCQGTTRRGEQCWNATSEREDFCTVHQPNYVRPGPRTSMNISRALDFADDRARELNDGFHSGNIRAGLIEIRRRMDK